MVSETQHAAQTVADDTKRETQFVQLRDGRRLCYAEFGDPSGMPLLFCHGGGDSRLQRNPDDSIAASLGIRLITPDRPGTGRSDPQRHRRLLDWPEDVSQLMAALDIDRFAILGYSLGAPFALACAWALRERVLAAGIVSGLGPFDRPGALDDVDPFYARMLRVGRRSRWLLQLPYLLLSRQALRDPYKLADKLFKDRTHSDREVYLNPPQRENFAICMQEGARQWSRGLTRDISLVTHPWGFRLEEITMPVHLWYGTADAATPLQVCRYLEATLPDAHLTLWEGEAHMAIFRHWREVLATLAGVGKNAE